MSNTVHVVSASQSTDIASSYLSTLLGHPSLSRASVEPQGGFSTTMHTCRGVVPVIFRAGCSLPSTGDARSRSQLVFVYDAGRPHTLYFNMKELAKLEKNMKVYIVAVASTLEGKESSRLGDFYLENLTDSTVGEEILTSVARHILKKDYVVLSSPILRRPSFIDTGCSTSTPRKEVDRPVKTERVSRITSNDYVSNLVDRVLDDKDVTPKTPDMDVLTRELVGSIAKDTALSKTISTLLSDALGTNPVRDTTPKSSRSSSDLLESLNEILRLTTLLSNKK